MKPDQSIKPSVQSWRSNDLLSLLLVLFTAALMRFGEPGIVEFFHDEAMVADLAQQMISGERFPFTGIISSVGIPNSPWTIYVLGLPFALSPDPFIATLFIMGWNVFGVGLVWWIARRYFGRASAIIAGMTYALSPWAILYSRKIWAQDYHTPFLLIALALGLYSLWEAEARPRWNQFRFWAQVAVLPFMLIGMQIHFAAWFLLPAFLYLFWRGRRNINLFALALAILVGAATLAPFALGLGQTLSADPTRVSNVLERSGEIGTGLQPEPLFYLLYLTTGLGVETWVAPQQQDEMLTAVPSPRLWWLIGVLILAGLIHALRSRENARLIGALLIIWSIGPVLLLLPGWTQVYPHYFVASIPALALLAGIGWHAADQLLKKRLRQILLIGYAVLLLTQGMWWRGALRFLDQTEIAYPGFTTPLHYLMTIRDYLSESQDVLVLSYGMSWSLHHESVVWPVLLRDQVQCVRTLVGEGYLVFPAQPFAVLVSPDAPRESTSYKHYSANPASQVFPTRAGSTPYTVYHWEKAPAWEPAEQIAQVYARFGSGVELTGYSQQNQRIILEWRLPQGSRTEDNWQYSVQVFNANGERLTQQDRPFWHTRHWCAGDRLLTWIDGIQIPEVATEIRISLYRLTPGGGFENDTVFDVERDAAGQQAIIPLP